MKRMESTLRTIRVRFYGRGKLLEEYAGESNADRSEKPLGLGVCRPAALAAQCFVGIAQGAT